ncbi:MAG: ABC transporter permease [Phycisphaerales bacterium]|nr:ABC transporter permease [Phycisphaerales bacterium]
MHRADAREGVGAPRPTRRGARLSIGALLGAGLLAMMALACFGSLPWTLGQAEGSRTARFAWSELDAARLPPSWAPHQDDERAAAEHAAQRHPLGTDALGRDVLTRLLLGGAVSLGIGLSAALISVVIGTAYGMIAGYAGGRVDAVMMRVVDVLYGLPYILLVVLLAVAADALADRAMAARLAAGASVDAIDRQRAWVNIATLLVAIGGVSWLTMARVVRGQTMSLKARPFVEAARAMGTPRRTIFLRHLLPNLTGPIVVYATLTAPQAILQESFLSFLGIGVSPPLPSWGNMAADGLSELNTFRARWWLLLFPCLALGATLIALNFLGEGLREAMDPRRSRRGRST